MTLCAIVACTPTHEAMVVHCIGALQRLEDGRMLAPRTTVHLGVSTWIFLPDQPSADSCSSRSAGRSGGRWAWVPITRAHHSTTTWRLCTQFALCKLYCRWHAPLFCRLLVAKTMVAVWRCAAWPIGRLDTSSFVCWGTRKLAVWLVRWHVPPQ